MKNFRNQCIESLLGSGGIQVVRLKNRPRREEKKGEKKLKYGEE